jgi:16S rRNA (guanine527-N7)-methyltransferase
MQGVWESFEILGFTLNKDLKEAFELFVQELIRWNQKINLTRIIKPEDILLKHILCSLSYLKVCAFKPGDQAIDIGSGAGFPGIPLKLYCPSLSITLLEPSSKKLAFLKHIGHLLGLKGIAYISEPVEVWGQKLDPRERFEWAMARGFGPLEKLIKNAALVIQSGGHLVVRKEANYLDEITTAAPIMASKGFKLERVVPINLESYKIKYYLLDLKKLPPEGR